MKKAIVSVTSDFLIKALQLPDNAILSGIQCNFYQHGIIELSLEGVGWEVEEGEKIQYAHTASCCTLYDPITSDADKVEIDWHLGE
jgi:hypothetical protein